MFCMVPCAQAGEAYVYISFTVRSKMQRRHCYLQVLSDILKSSAAPLPSKVEGNISQVLAMFHESIKLSYAVSYLHLPAFESIAQFLSNITRI